MQQLATIAFIRDQKRDAFLYARSDGSLEELTFLETAKRFQCVPTNGLYPCMRNTTPRCSRQWIVFRNQVEAEKAQDKKVDITQGPNEKKALVYLDAFTNLPFISDEEKSLIVLAKEAIRKGRFQNLQRDVNKLQRSQAKVKVQPAILLEKLVQLLIKYPLTQPEPADEPVVPTPVIAVTEPAIIISESFSA